MPPVLPTSASTKLVTLLLCGMLMGLVACSDEPEPATGTGTKSATAPASLTAACTTIATARCEAVKTCCGDAKPAPRALPACVKNAEKACADGLVAAWSAITTGAAAVSEPAVKACVAAVQTGAKDCLPPDEVEASCGAFVRDAAALNGTCGATALTCAGGKGRCVSEGGKPPRCLAFATSGEACNPATCTPPLRCVPKSAGATASICRLAGGDGASCSSHADCSVGLSCQATGTCGTGANEGKPCSGTGSCGDGFACDDTQGKCVARVVEGATCLAHVHCQAGLACTGLGLKGTCVPQTALGAPCNRTLDCKGSLFCHPTTGTCTSQSEEGKACAGSDSCGALLYCDVDDKTCKPLPGEGKPCAYNVRTCLPGLTCYQPTKKDRTCVKPRKKGEKCTQHNNCETGFGCGKGVCVDLPKTGEACLDQTYCKDGWCDHDTSRCEAWLAAGKACKGGHECGPDGACVGTKRANLKCVAQPDEGESCLLTCKSGLLCALSKVAGVCQPAICSAAGG